MWFYGLSSVFKFTALCRLRYKMPDYPRPYKIPVGDVASATPSFLPLFFFFLLLFYQRFLLITLLSTYSVLRFIY
jgi:hypothetical protein